MLSTFVRVLAIPVLMASIAMPLAASAADEPSNPIIEALPPQLAARLAARKSALMDVNLAGPGAPKGVVAAMQLWPATLSQIRICFFGGTDALRQRIADIALQWTGSSARIPLDFGSPPRSCGADDQVNHIRISFDQAGYWSVVGAQSADAQLVPQSQASMNLARFALQPPDEDEFRRVVLHEFGHALGFHHEHQNPFSSCQTEFDFDRIYEILGQPPNSWSKKQVDFNLRGLHEQGLLATNFDAKSIMLYSFPEQYYKNGTQSSCYHSRNTVLSEMDLTTIAEMYPAAQQRRLDLQRERRRALLKHLAKQETSGATKSLVHSVIDQYVPDVK